MTARLRWAVYRPTMAAPIYLGDVLAPDREAAVRAGQQTYGGAVVAHRATSRAASPALERALQAVTKRNAGFRRGGRRGGGR